MSTIRTLHVAQPTSAGVALAVVQLATDQIERGWKVTVACPGDGPLAPRLLDLGADVERWDATREPSAATAKEVSALRTIVGRVDPTVVHLHSSKAGLAGRLAVRGARPTIFQPNAWSFLPPGRSQRPARGWERFAARWTDLFVLVSEREQELAHEAGIRGETFLVRNGVDLSAFAYVDDAGRSGHRRALGLGAEPIVVCVGRLSEQKGQLGLVQRWGDVRAAVPDARLVLVGDGPDRAAIEAAGEAGVQLVGEQSDVRPWLGASDVVVQPSRWEGQSFATVEAMAVGRPVVAFAVEGMEDAIERSGRLLRPGDEPGLTAALAELLGDRDERDDLGALARKRAEDHFDAAVSCAGVTERTLELAVERNPALRRPGGPSDGTRPDRDRAPAEAGTPTFLLIGAARSGTTFLAHHLGRHPDVHLSEPKEPHFLAYGGHGDEFHGPGDETVLTRTARFDEASWRALFPGTTAAQGEGSVSTLYRPDRAVPTIERLCADARLLAVLRDPVDRAYSAWSYQVSRGFEELSFADALDAEPHRIAEGWQHLWHYVGMGRYAEQLAPFIESVGRDRLLVVDYDELSRDPAAVLERSFAFLEVEPIELRGLELDVNAGGQPRSVIVLQAMKAARSVEPVRQAVRKAVPFGVRERLRNANLRSDTIDADVRARLDAIFEPERRALAALLGPDAPAWATP